jgi:TolA-binding protein
MMTRIHRRFGLPVAVLGAALVMSAFPAPAHAGKKKAKPQPPPQQAAVSVTTQLQEAGLTFEQARLLSDADRSAGLEEALQITTRAMQRGGDDEKAGARFLSGEIRYGMQRYGEATEEFRRAEDGLRKTPFADDAAFAAIQAMEAAGRDAEAAKAWVEWEGRYAQSPLLGEARLAAAWNAIRRGDPAMAAKTLAALIATRPWYANDPRATLAQATVLYQRGKPTEALAMLGAKPAGAAAVYLRALCLRNTGSLLKAAASFQDVADRYPDSNLRDYALLAKADAFLKAKDYRSARRRSSARRARGIWRDRWIPRSRSCAASWSAAAERTWPPAPSSSSANP